MSLFAVILLCFALVFAVLSFIGFDLARGEDKFLNPAILFSIAAGVFIIAAGVWK